MPFYFLSTAKSYLSEPPPLIGMDRYTPGTARASKAGVYRPWRGSRRRGGVAMNNLQRAWILPLAASLLAVVQAANGETARAVTVSVDASRVTGPLPPVWRFFGADEPNYATMKDGRKLLAELGRLRHGQVYFRAHNLLSTGDGTPAFKWGSTNIYTEVAGKPVYDFTVVDRI